MVFGVHGKLLNRKVNDNTYKKESVRLVVGADW